MTKFQIWKNNQPIETLIVDANDIIEGTTPEVLLPSIMELKHPECYQITAEAYLIRYCKGVGNTLSLYQEGNGITYVVEEPE